MLRTFPKVGLEPPKGGRRGVTRYLFALGAWGKGGLLVYKTAKVLIEVPNKFSWSSKQQDRQHVLSTLEATLRSNRKSWHDALAYTDNKNWTKNCIKFALVHMHKTRLENLPNHTRDRRTFACASSRHQHLDQVDSTRAESARVQKIVEDLAVTATAVGLRILSSKNCQ